MLPAVEAPCPASGCQTGCIPVAAVGISAEGTLPGAVDTHSSAGVEAAPSDSEGRTAEEGPGRRAAEEGPDRRAAEELVLVHRG